MDNLNESSRKRKTKAPSKARERRAQRQKRREAMVSIRDEGLSKITTIVPEGVSMPKGVTAARHIVLDTLWHLIYRTAALKIIGGIVAVIVVLFFISQLFRSDIGPNIWSLGVDLGSKSLEEAESALIAAWNQDTRISIRLEGEQITSVRPSEIGITLDAYTTALNAKEAGLAGFPFGHEIEPVVVSSFASAQEFMLNISDDVYIPPLEASYAWRDGEVIGVSGSASRELDITLSVQHITENPLSILRSGRLELLTTSTPPNVVNPMPFVLDAQRFIDSNFTVIGYDPFLDDEQLWQTTPDELAGWLQAGETNLIINQNGLEDFVESVNRILALEDAPRYLDENEVAEDVQYALLTEANSISVRIRYQQDVYIVTGGDTGIDIGRKTGLPFGRIQAENPNVEWTELYIGQELMLPSRDIVLPEDPIPNKRIVVDLERLWLVGYENDEVVFYWPISSGMSGAPTYPGIYQVLEKEDKAYGSSFSLCNGNGDCGQWEMDYFMSIYEVAPGLMNGFHGAVLLPNGGYLDGGSNQRRSTFGCVMSDNEQARLLFEWAEIGTVVEIISPLFPPESDIAYEAMRFIDSLEGDQT